MPMTAQDYAERIACQVADDFAVNPELWTTGALARTAEGKETSPTDPDAVCWCALGRRDFYVDKVVPNDPDLRKEVNQRFQAIGGLAEGYLAVDDVVNGEAYEYAPPRYIYANNDSQASSYELVNPETRARGAKAVAKFLRAGVAKLGKTCLGRPA